MRLQKTVALRLTKLATLIEIAAPTPGNSLISETFVLVDLFAKEKLHVLQNIKLLDKKQKSWLKNHSENLDSTLVIYHPSIISKTYLNSLPKLTKIEEYKLPKLIWKFLESIYPGNAKNSILLFHQVLKNEPPEFIFHLVAKLFRDMFWVKTDSGSLNYPSWRAMKLKRQGSMFNLKKIKEMIRELARADLRSKTSGENIIDLLDFLIATKLE